MSPIGTQRQFAAVCSLSGSWGRADADRRGRTRRLWPRAISRGRGERSPQCSLRWCKWA